MEKIRVIFKKYSNLDNLEEEKEHEVSTLINLINQEAKKEIDEKSDEIFEKV